MCDLIFTFPTCFSSVTAHLCPHNKAKLHQLQIFRILSAVRNPAHYTKNPNTTLKDNLVKVDSSDTRKVDEQGVKIPPNKSRRGEDTRLKDTNVQDSSCCTLLNMLKSFDHVQRKAGYERTWEVTSFFAAQ